MTGAIHLLYLWLGGTLSPSRTGPSLSGNTSAPAAGNVTFFEGEDYVQPFAVKDAAGAAVDITGWSLTLTARSHFDSTGAAVVTKSASVVSGPLGTCKVIFARADTVGLTPKSYAYDLSRVDPGADSCLVVGYLHLLDRAR